MHLSDVLKLNCDTKYTVIYHNTFEDSMSGYKVEIIPGYPELNSFDRAVDQHNAHVGSLLGLVDNLKKRIADLKNAKSSGLYLGPKEFDEHQKAIKSVSEFENRRRALETIEKEKQDKLRELREKLNADVQARKDNIMTDIKKRWDYFWRCAEYNIKNNVCRKYCSTRREVPHESYKSYFESKMGSVTKDSNLDTLDLLATSNLSDTMVRVIKHAHKDHNYKSITTDESKYTCPAQDCHDSDCFAYSYSDIDGHHTNICRKNVRWDTSGVDWIDGVNLDDKKPAGELIRYYIW